MDLQGTLLKINEKDRLFSKLDDLDREEFILTNEEDEEEDVEVVEVNYVNGTKRLIWSMVGLFVILYAIFLEKRFENVDFWDGFFVIGILALCLYIVILLIQHKRGRNVLMTRSKIESTLDEIDLQNKKEINLLRAKKARIQEIKQERLQIKTTIKILDTQLEDSIVPPMYREAHIVRSFIKNIDNLRAKTLRDAIIIYNEERRRIERDNQIFESRELRRSLETISDKFEEENL